MARRAAPALYELMRRPGAPVASASSPATAGSSRRLGNAPGLPSTFEISLRRAIVIGIAVVVAVSIAYGIGVKRGSSAQTGAARNGSDAESVSTPSAVSQQTSPVIPAIPGKSSGATGSKTAASVPGTSGSGKSAPAARAATDNKSDPRVKGMYYFVVGHPSSDRRVEMLTFCRAEGLDAYLVPDDNALLRKIIVLPGYRDLSEKSSSEIKALEAKIKQVGKKWKGNKPGNKDFDDAYPALFK
jgi:hypothetical protein